MNHQRTPTFDHINVLYMASVEQYILGLFSKQENQNANILPKDAIESNYHGQSTVCWVR